MTLDLTVFVLPSGLPGVYGLSLVGNDLTVSMYGSLADFDQVTRLIGEAVEGRRALDRRLDEEFTD